MQEETTGEPVKKCQVVYTAPWGDQFVATVVEQNPYSDQVFRIYVPEIQEEPFAVNVQKIKSLPKPIRPGDVLEIPEDREPWGVLPMLMLIFGSLSGFAVGFRLAAEIAEKGVCFGW